MALSTPVSQACVGQYCSPDKLCLTIQTWQMSAHVCHLCNIVISLGISIHTRIKPWIPDKLSSFIWHVSLNGLYCAIRLWECFLHFFLWLTHVTHSVHHYVERPISYAFTITAAQILHDFRKQKALLPLITLHFGKGFFSGSMDRFEKAIVIF